MDPFVAALDTLVNLAMLLGLSLAAGFILPISWRQSSFILGITWGVMPAVARVIDNKLLLFLAEGGLFQFRYWTGPAWSFLFLAWPLLMLAVAALGAFLGSRLRGLFFYPKRQRDYE